MGKDMVPLSEALGIATWQPLLELQRKPPRSAIKFREGADGQMYPYLESVWVVQRFNAVLGHLWSFDLPFPPDYRMSKVLVGNTLVDRGAFSVVVRLTVQTPWGPVSRAQAGSQVQKQGMEVGDALKGAISDGLKKAASLFGLGLALEKGEQTVTLEGEVIKTDPLIETLQRLATQAGVTVEEQAGNPVSQLTRKELLILIRQLRNKIQEKKEETK